jgi:O-antigen/teichoic acid export membrane protein
MFTPVSERSDALQRNVKIANLIALIFAILALVLLLATIWLFGTSVSTPFTILTSLVYLFCYRIKQVWLYEHRQNFALRFYADHYALHNHTAKDQRYAF